MATPAPDVPKAQMVYCPVCKDHFISYKLTGPSVCPRCGQSAKAPPQRHYTRLVAFAALAVVIIAIVAYFILR